MTVWLLVLMISAKVPEAPLMVTDPRGYATESKCWEAAQSRGFIRSARCVKVPLDNRDTNYFGD